jgi:hypothetical protein
MALEIETALYNEMLPQLLESSMGKYVVIKGRDVIGVFDDMNEGYRAALDKYGVTNFLLQPVRAEEPKLDFSNLQFGVVRGGV